MKLNNIFKSSSIIIFCLLLITFLISSIVSARDEFKGQFSKNEIFQIKSLDNYNEAPSLKKLVEAGKLPPIKERLPEEPRVVQTNIMADGIGEYGGVLRETFGSALQSWNWGAGQSQGYFGMNQIVQEALVKIGPMWMMESPEPLPNLATDWSWSEDGKTLTMHLLKGAKWSDGEPFNADDVLFTYNYYILDKNIPSWGTESTWTYGEKVTEVEKVDDYTIKWHFGVANPYYAFFRMDQGDFSIVPKHVYKHFHPEFNPDATYDDLLNSTPPQDLPPVVMGPWVPVQYKPGSMVVLERNPYYWEVDEDGNQLPYLDEVWYRENTSERARPLNVIAGQGDITGPYDPAMFSILKKESVKEDAKFNLNRGPYLIGYGFYMNMTLNEDAENARDKELPRLFRKLKFRQAISHAVNRKGIASSAFPGLEITIPWYGGYTKGSPNYEESLITKYPYNPDKARQLLAELGFEDTDNNGFVNWPEDSLMSGEDLNIEILVTEDLKAGKDIADALVSLFSDIGIDLRVKMLKGSIMQNKINSGDFEFNILRQDEVTQYSHMSAYGPVDKASPSWHQARAGGERQLLPFEKEIQSMMQEVKTVIDARRRTEIFKKILEISTENVYTVGVYQSQTVFGVNKRLKNFQPDMPIFYYSWTQNNIPIQIIWTPKNLQKQTRFTDYIPTAENYKNRSWHKPIE